MSLRNPPDYSDLKLVISLLNAYDFDLGNRLPSEHVNQWLAVYSPRWIKMATIEALFLGRYKSISVEQLLMQWAKRGRPLFRHTKEFERLISQKLPKHWREENTLQNDPQRQVNKDSSEPSSQIPRKSSPTSQIKVPGVIQQRCATSPAPQQKPITGTPVQKNSLDSSRKKAPIPDKTDVLRETKRSLDTQLRRRPESISQFIPISRSTPLLNRLQLVLQESSSR